MNSILDCYPEWDSTGGGVFKDLYTRYANNFTWLTAYEQLDREYFGNRSGFKKPAPIITKYLALNSEETHPEQLTAAQRVKICDMIVQRFSTKWVKLYAILFLEYNPIENYSSVETESHSNSNKHSASSDYKVTDERKVGTDVTTETSNSSDANTYGFNSAGHVPVSDQAASGINHTVGDAEDNTETQTHEQTGYTEDTDAGQRYMTRSGNIGVTTSQQMIESEIALWQWNFFESVYKDIDTLITCPVYDI